MQYANHRDAGRGAATGAVARRPLAVAVLAATLVGAVLAGCETARPVPVEVRGRTGQPPAATGPEGQPSPTGEPTPAAAGQPGTAPPPGGGAPGGAAQPAPGAQPPGATQQPPAPLGPSGRPLRTEPFGFKRAFGEPPREVRSPGGPGMAAVTVLPPSVTPGAQT